MQHAPSNLSSAGIVGIVVVVFVFAFGVIATAYFYVREPLDRLLRELRPNGATAADYMTDQRDAAAQIPTAPPYCDLPTLPPPYSPRGTVNKPPDYEMVMLRDKCVYRPRIESDTAESDAGDDRPVLHHSSHT